MCRKPLLHGQRTFILALCLSKRIASSQSSESACKALNSFIPCLPSLSEPHRSQFCDLRPLASVSFSRNLNSGSFCSSQRNYNKCSSVMEVQPQYRCANRKRSHQLMLLNHVVNRANIVVALQTCPVFVICLFLHLAAWPSVMCPFCESFCSQNSMQAFDSMNMGACSSDGLP